MVVYACSSYTWEAGEEDKEFKVISVTYQIPGQPGLQKTLF